ncbi:MAG TPA: hypothetical protein PKN24_13050 [bacterium]|nr:hypothetical protein [bacterium]
MIYSFSKNQISLAVLLILSVIANPVFGWANEESSSWFSILLGVNPDNFKKDRNANGSGLTIGLIYSRQRLFKDMITFRILRSAEVGFVPIADTNYPYESLNEVSLLYGRFINHKNIHISGSIGLSFVAGINRGNWIGTIGIESYECERLPYYSIGIPVAFQINSNASGSCGIGLQLFGNYNRKQPIFGLAFLIKFGKQK